MIREERLTSYLHSLISDETGAVLEIEREAVANDVPIIRKETKELLKVLVRLANATKILEIGTAVGYSAILMCIETGSRGTVTTIENYPPRIEKAKENFKKVGLTERITLLEGDANDILPTLTETYDLIFMDAAKGQYLNYLPEALRLLKTGGLLITDNVLQDGDVLESKFATLKRNRTIHDRMRDYLYTITHTDYLQTTVIPIGDGLAVSIKGESDEA